MAHFRQFIWTPKVREHAHASKWVWEAFSALFKPVWLRNGGKNAI